MKLVVQDISKAFGHKEVLNQLTYTFESGQITGLLGRNGAGKTTLMSILYEDYQADSGTCFLLDSKGVERSLTADDVGMVFSDNFLPEFLTGYEFVKFFLDIHQPEDKARVDDYLEQVDISPEDRHRLIKGYSDGMKSKLSLLTVLIKKPKVILLDEPLTAVDLISGMAIQKLLLALRDEHIVILSTHMMSLAEDLCDTVVVLDKGKLTNLNLGMEKAVFEERLLEVLRGGGTHA